MNADPTRPDPVPPGQADGGRARRLLQHRRAPVAILAVVWALVAVPLVVAVVVLRTRAWHPVLDLAMTEFRVRDTGGRHTPLIGLPGRIGTFPDQGSHPGPLSFWLLAPLYRIAGSSAWALLVAATTIAAAAATGTAWAALRRIERRLRWVALPVVAVVMVVVLRGYGTGVLTQPWNPYLPVMVWAFVLVAVWGVLLGDLPMLVVVAAAGSFAAQTHIPYLGLWLGMLALVVAVVVVRAIREPTCRPATRRWGLITGALLGVLWAPVAVDQVVRSPGNVTRIIDHFASPPTDEVTVGWARAVVLVLRHLDLVDLVRRSFDGSAPDGVGAFVRAGYELDTATDAWGPAIGTMVFVGWVVTVGLAWRRRDRVLLALHTVVGWSLLLAVVSLARVFGLVWFYLTLWLWLTTVLLVVAALWTLWRASAARRSRVDRAGSSRGAASGVPAISASVMSGPAVSAPVMSGPVMSGPVMSRPVMAGLALVGLVTWSAFTVEAVNAPAPEQHLSDTLAAIVEPTAAALGTATATAPDGASGADRRYTVTYQDAANFGSLAYGLVNELERRGFTVGMPVTWRVPVTAHRVISELDATAEIRLATGRFIDEVAALPGAVLVATHDPRDADDTARFAALRSSVEADLRAAGLDDLVALLDDNLFGVRIDLRVPPAVIRDVDEMIRLGVPTAVFVLPPPGAE